MCWIFVKRTYSGRSLLKPYYRSEFNESSKAAVHVSKVSWKFTPWVKFYFGLSLHIFLWKMRATPGACINPGCLTRRQLCHKVNLPASYESRCPLCHKANLLSCVTRRPYCHNVNLPSCVARRPLFHKVNLPLCEPRRRHFIMTCHDEISPFHVCW